MAKSPKLPPSNSDTLAFSKKEQLGRSSPVPDRTDVPFSKKQQRGKSRGATRPTPPTITRQRPSLSDANLPFSKTKHKGKAPGAKTRPVR